MNSSGGTGRSIVIISLLLGVSSACATSPDQLPTALATPTAKSESTLSAAAAPVDASVTPKHPIETAPQTASASTQVQVTVLGNLYVRRGPDLAFNPIAVLPTGAVVGATGRDVLSDWVRIPLPSNNSEHGWISIMSGFTRTQGDVSALPEIDPQEWPDLASVRNCTYHELWIEPAGITLPPVFEFPNNDLRLNPGIYSVVDVDVDSYPEILTIDLREGMTVEVLVDGLGEKKKCPPP